jgi:hypothetical protein
MSSHEVQQKLDQYLAPQTAKRAMTSAHLPRTKIHRTTVDDEDIFRDGTKLRMDNFYQYIYIYIYIYFFFFSSVRNGPSVVVRWSDTVISRKTYCQQLKDAHSTRRITMPLLKELVVRYN